MALTSKEEPRVGAQPFRVLHKGYSFTQPLRQGLKTSTEDLDNAIPMKRWKSPAMINHWLVSYFFITLLFTKAAGNWIHHCTLFQKRTAVAISTFLQPEVAKAIP